MSDHTLWYTWPHCEKCRATRRATVTWGSREADPRGTTHFDRAMYLTLEREAKAAGWTFGGGAGWVCDKCQKGEKNA
jgi:hypothetical protein